MAVRKITLEELKEIDPDISEEVAGKILALQSKPAEGKRLKHSGVFTTAEAEEIKKKYPSAKFKRPNYK